MEFKYRKKKFTYNPETGQAHDLKGKLADPEVVEHFHRMCHAIRCKGFNYRMNYKELRQHLSVLDEEEQEKLFHNIYERYNYCGLMLNSTCGQLDFHKIMAKMKRYEKYLYIILGGEDLVK